MGVILQDLLLETVLDHSDLVHLRCLLRGPVNILFSVFVGLGLFNRVPIQLESVDVKFGFLSSWGPCSFSPDCFTYLLTMLDLSEWPLDCWYVCCRDASLGWYAIYREVLIQNWWVAPCPRVQTRRRLLCRCFIWAYFCELELELVTIKSLRFYIKITYFAPTLFIQIVFYFFAYFGLANSQMFVLDADWTHLCRHLQLWSIVLNFRWVNCIGYTAVVSIGRKLFWRCDAMRWAPRTKHIPTLCVKCFQPSCRLA